MQIHTHLPEPCVLVIFGASGDLTKRKLIPALYDLDRQGRLPEGLCVLGNGRTEMNDDTFRVKMLEEGVRTFAAAWDEAVWVRFARRLHYQACDPTQPEGFSKLTARIGEVGGGHGLIRCTGAPNVLFYLSVSPQYFEPIIECIGQSGLVAENRRWCSINPEGSSWQRIVVEKPFGVDLASAESLNRALGRVFEEEAIFRIDHYLGKELVQNILAMRFANTIFEPLWNRTYVDHVQVTATETVGVGKRAGGFYDGAGALRDMVQSHLFQVLALVAMEPPSLYDAGAIMREKIKLFKCATPIPSARVGEWAVFGRYGPSGNPKDEDEGRGYTQLEGVETARATETYAAMRVQFENWRWAGVPFYVRSGKKLASKLTEVVVQFRSPPTNMFRHLGADAAARPANRLIINIAPREGVSLRIEGKVPGAGLKLDSAKLDLDYLERFGGEVIEAYGPLLLDAMRGDRILYKHRDEVEAGWSICEPILTSAALRSGIHTYAPASWGPAAADEMLARDGRAWHNPRRDEVR
ncbi:MAG: glucose-6-phosphate dehydrogenase [Phycisphaerae bacterium]|nr:glucose-6-phosphate dehydrogenase [Phycisphaerae bacterium]